MSQKFRKSIFIAIIFVFIFNICFLNIQSVKAVPTEVMADVPATTFGIKNIIWQKIGKTIQTVGSGVFKRTLSTFMTNLAKQSAETLATGAAGGKPLWDTQAFSKTLKEAGDAALGDFLDGMMSGINIDICQPPSVDLNLKVSIYMKSANVTKNKARCNLSDIVKKWGSAMRDPSKIATLNGQALTDAGKGFGIISTTDVPIIVASTTDTAATTTYTGFLAEEMADAQAVKAVLQQKTYSFMDSDLNFLTNIGEFAAEKMSKVVGSEITNKENPDAPKAKTFLITQDIKSPNIMTEEEAKKIKSRNEESAKVTTGDIFVDSANIFTSTFISKYLEKMVANLFKDSQDPPSEDIANDSNFFSPTIKPLSMIDSIFASINAISMNLNPKNIDVVTEMSMPTQEGSMSNMNNGTISDDLSDILTRSKMEPLTLEQAVVQQPSLGAKSFGFIESGGGYTQPQVGDGFSYDNIKKLRKNRVVPVGWELAALKIEKAFQDRVFPSECINQKCTLGGVMGAYNETGSFARTKSGATTTIKDKYCGYRSITSDPYNVSSASVDSSSECNNIMLTNQGFTSAEFDILWMGSGGVAGYCYEYAVTDGVITSVPTNNTSVTSQSDCEGNVTKDLYREWIPGGCVVKEKNESPFCHLVDPNWVLKAPQQQCAAKGSYSALEADGQIDRYEDCADVKNCIKENDKGECLGYGYCLREKNIWRFGGKSCNSQFASCTKLKDDLGVTKSYLIDTLKDCPENEAGCKAYVNYKTGSTTSSTIPWTWNERGNYRTLYLNKNVKSCDSKNGGCNKFIEIKPGANLVGNPSFESTIVDGNQPDGWYIGAPNNFSISTSSPLADGPKFLQHNYTYTDNFSTTSSTLRVPDKGLFTLSYYAKKTGVGAGAITPMLIYKRLGVEGIVTVTNVSSSTIYSVEDGAENDIWERKSGYFSITNPNSFELEYAELRFIVTGFVAIDAVQFEINKFLNSDIHDGPGEPSQYSSYGSGGGVYYKKAPAYYNCAMYPNQAVCSGYMKECTRTDNGCEAYTPTNGDVMIPAIPKQEDICPSECNGYSTFTEYPNFFQKIEANQMNNSNSLMVDKDFIMNTATDCPENEESCELFTNIDKLNKGGESREYYSFVRQCVKPSEASSTPYYTWEGSDTTGFQLKSWRFLKSNLPLSSDVKAPCTRVTIGGNTCNDNSSVVDCDTETDLDCRLFYDKSGNTYKRKISQTIPVVDECIDLRREASTSTPQMVYKVSPSLSTTCSASNVGCKRYKGNNGDNIRRAFYKDFEDNSASGWTHSGDDIYISPSNESTAYNGHSLKIQQMDASSPAITVVVEYPLTDKGYVITPGKKYTLSFWGKMGSPVGLLNSTGVLVKVIDKIKATFYDKVFASSDDLGDVGANDGNVIFTPEKNMTDEWRLYEYANPVLAKSPDDGKYYLKFEIRLPRRTSAIYLDNITLKEITSDFYKIQNSWNTPDACNAYLGCQEYKDRANTTWYFNQFSKLCEEQNVGCTAMIDTNNSGSPFQKTFNAYCNSTTTDGCTLGKYYDKEIGDINSSNISSSTIKINRDELVYVVKDKQYSCISDSKGCQAVGFMTSDGEYANMYKVNDPDSYSPDSSSGILCTADSKDCTVFGKSNGSTVFKIHPRNKICEYNNGDGDVPAGFYMNGNTASSCDSILYNKNYDEFINRDKNSADNFNPFADFGNNYAATCDNTQDKCSMFIDPLDNKDVVSQYNQDTGYTISLSSNSWKQSKWDRTTDGGEFNINGNQATLSSGIVSFNIQNQKDSLVYINGGTSSPDEPRGFGVNDGDVYRLSAMVQFDGNNIDNPEMVSTFLSCNEAKNSHEHYLKSGTSIPYAFPSVKSEYSYKEVGLDTTFHQVYGLYKILPGAKYCTVAFRFNGKTGSTIQLKDIKFEKVSGTYYYLDNDDIDKKSCTSVGLKDGCVLFNNTSGALSRNSGQSYLSGNVVPGNIFYPSDSNDLIKVVRDRECGEWDVCSSNIKTINKDGTEKSSCVSLIGCDKTQDGTTCDNYIIRQNIKPLTLDTYQESLGTNDWGTMNYSGYSIPGQYAPDTLSAFKMKKIISGVTTTPYVLGRSIVKNNISFNLGLSVNPLGDASNIGKDKSEISCRLYPEKSSPFPWIIKEESGVVTNGAGYTATKTSSSDNSYFQPQGTDRFTNANICQPSFGFASSTLRAGETCDCSYIKASYGSGGISNLYFPYSAQSVIPQKIYADDEGSSTLNLKKVIKNIGWNGFCLDYDKSIPVYDNNYRCLSWYPVDMISGGVDSGMISPEADIVQNETQGIIPTGGKMCLVGENYTTKEDRIYCGYFDKSGTNNDINSASVCTVLVKVPNGSKISLSTITSSTIQSAAIQVIKDDASKIWLPTTSPLFTIGEVMADVPSLQKIQVVESGVSTLIKTNFTTGSIGGKDVGAGVSVIDLLKQVFNGNTLEYYYYDEAVDSSGNITAGAEAVPENNANQTTFVNLGEYTTKPSAGSFCGSHCGDAGEYSVCGGGGRHKVGGDCERTEDSPCGDCCDRQVYNYCNPGAKNYYVRLGGGSGSSGTYYTGHCSKNCVGNLNGINYNHGLTCLWNAGIASTSSNPYKAIENGPNGMYDVTACTNYGFDHEDCQIYAAFDGVASNSPCDLLNDKITQAMFDGATQPMKNILNACLNGTTTVNGIAFNNMDFPDMVYYDNNSIYPSQATECMGNINCDTQTCTAYTNAAYIFSESLSSTSSVQSCKTYANLNTTGNLFKANNLYLNNIPKENISSAALPTGNWFVVGNFCNIYPTVSSTDFINSNVCPVMNFGPLNNNDYGDGHKFRSDGVWASNDATWSFNSMATMPKFGIYTQNNDSKPILFNKMGGESLFGTYNSYGGNNINEAKSNLRVGNLIVKLASGSAKTINVSNNYVQDNNIFWDDSTSAPTPFIKQVSSTQSGGYFGTANGITINGKNNEDYIVSGKNNANIDLTFYAFANEDQTPIKEIKICWDGSSNCSIFTGPFKNHKADCVRQCGGYYTYAFDGIGAITPCITDADCTNPTDNKCFAKTWGDTEDACVEDVKNEKNSNQVIPAYFKFNHVYTCSSNSSNWNAGNGSCSFNPSVTVTDNWGKPTTVNMGSKYIIIKPTE